MKIWLLNKPKHLTTLCWQRQGKIFVLPMACFFSCDASERAAEWQTAFPWTLLHFPSCLIIFQVSRASESYSQLQTCQRSLSPCFWLAYLNYILWIVFVCLFVCFRWGTTCSVCLGTHMVLVLTWDPEHHDDMLWICVMNNMAGTNYFLHPCWYVLVCCKDELSGSCSKCSSCSPLCLATHVGLVLKHTE